MFDYEIFLPMETYQKINDIKTFKSYIIKEETAIRKKPGYPHKKLVFAAADHNARMIHAYKGDPYGLTNRREYLARLVRILCSRAVDGVEASPDIIEDLIILNYIWKKEKDIDFLDGKMLVGTVNRGGLKDTAWEMDDMCTCFTIDRICELNLDGVKFMLRINPDCETNKNTLRYCAEIINQASKVNLPIFLEALFIRTIAGKYVMQTDLESLVKTVGVASALGETSAQKWIELPLNSEYNKAVASSTCSFFVVPDEIGQTPLEVVEEYTAQSEISFNVRGILLGRNVMYSEEDPMTLADVIAKVWHGDLSKADMKKFIDT